VSPCRTETNLVPSLDYLQQGKVVLLVFVANTNMHDSASLRVNAHRQELPILVQAKLMSIPKFGWFAQISFNSKRVYF
jgi:hypothetical protein